MSIYSCVSFHCASDRQAKEAAAVGASSIICQSGGALEDALYDYDAHFQIALRNEDAIFYKEHIPFLTIQ